MSGNSMVFRLRIVLVLLVFGVFLSGQEVTRRKVRVGFYATSGFQEQLLNGVRKGYAYDFLQYISKRTGWDYEYIGYDKDITYLLQKLKCGEIDLVCPISHKPEREDQFAFSSKVCIIVYTNITVREGDLRYNSLDYKGWDDMTVGVVAHYNAKQYLDKIANEHGITFNYSIYNTEDECHKALIEGRVDAMASPSIRQLDREWLLARFNRRETFFVVNKNNKELLAELDGALERLEFELPFLREHLTIKYYGKATVASMLTREQNFVEKCLKEGTVFRALLDADRYPLCYKKDGQFYGAQYEALKEIMERTRLNFEIIPCNNHKEYVNKLRNGDFDIVLDAGNSFNRSEHDSIHLSRQYLTVPVSMLHRKKNSAISGKYSILTDSLNYESLILSGVKDNEILLRDSMAEIVEDVKNGTADIGVLPPHSSQYVVESDSLRSLSAKLHPSMFVGFCIGYKRDLPCELLTILNNAITSSNTKTIADTILEQDDMPDKELNFKDWIIYNPVKSSLVSAAIVLLMLCLVVNLVLSGKRARRDAKVLARLPKKFFVVNSKHKILLSNMRAADYGDLRLATTPQKIEAEVEIAFDKGQTSYNYSGEDGSKHTLVLTPLPQNIFGEKTVLGIEQDTTELQNALLEAHINRKRLELTLRSIGDAIIVTDVDQKITMVNHVAARLINLKPEEMEGQYLSDIMTIVNSRDGSAKINPVAKCLQEGSITESLEDTVLVSRDGTHCHIAVSAAPIITGKGRKLGAILDIRDITGDYEQRQELKSTTEFLEQSFNFAPFMFFSKRQKGDRFEFMHVNEYASRFSSIPSEDMKGKTTAEIGQPREVVLYLDRQDKETAAALGKVHVFNIELKNEIGETRTIQYFRKSFVNFRGELIILCAGFDVTELVAQRNELKKAIAMTEAADRAKSYFLAVMSHEIRTPLNAVIGLTELLLGGDYSSEERTEYLQSINDSGKALLHLINGVLDLAKLEAGQMQIKPRPCSVQQLLNEMVSIFRLQMEKKGLELKVSSSDFMPVLEFDDVRVRQILLNLIGNAVKFTTEGGVKLHAAFIPDSGKDSGTLTLEVSDTGVGMSEEFLKHVFEPFKQEDEQRGTRKYGGTGLGLSIANKMAEAMNGSLTVKSKIGNGSTFILTLNDVKYSADEHEQKKEPLKSLPAGKKRFLIVDDVPVNLKVLSLTLGKLGADVTQAASGAQALEMFSNGHFDVVLTDILMPEMSGIELAAKIRELHTSGPVLIYGLTADTDVVGDYDSSCFDGVLSKPVNQDKLRELCGRMEA